MMHHWPDKLRHQQGAALLLVLWALVILISAIGLAAGRGDSVVEQVIALDEALQQEQDLFSTREALIYLLSSRRLNRGGLPLARHGIDVADREHTIDMGSVPVDPRGDEFLLDGSIYAGFGTIRWALQDQNGLLNPVFAPTALEALLDFLDNEQRNRRSLLATLDHYTSTGERSRTFAAAVPSDYEDAGLPPPAHRRLIVAGELRRLPGWDKTLTGDVGDRALALLGSLRYTPLNINTAPPGVLVAELGLQPDHARNLVEKRPLDTARAMEQAVGRGLGVTPDQIITTPGRFQRLHLWRGAGNGARVIELELTPTSNRGAPWRMHARYPRRWPKSASGPAPPEALEEAWLQQRGRWQMREDVR